MNFSTPFTQMMGCKIPLIAAPMFLVSNEDLVVRTSERGCVGTFPALNYRPVEDYKRALKTIKSRTQKPIGVNIIVNQSNSRRHEDLKFALDAGVELFITSLGNPKEVIKEAHRIGSKVICDVTNLEHAKKVEQMGADGVIAVCHGAGGHAGPLSPFALIPWLKREISIPIVAAGAIADGASMAAALMLGASAVSVGTRFIASTEASVVNAYKEAVVNSTPEDIIMTTQISGTPASVIRTDYMNDSKSPKSLLIDSLMQWEKTKKLVRPFVYYLGMKSLEESANKPSWKTVWSAGQSVGAVEHVLSCDAIVDQFLSQFLESVKSFEAMITSNQAATDMGINEV